MTGGEGSREGVGQLVSGRGWDMSWNRGVRCVMGYLTGWGDWKGIGRWGWSGNGVGCRGNGGVDGGRGRLLTVKEELQRNELEWECEV